MPNTDELRQQIEVIDEQIIDLIATRMEIADELAKAKKKSSQQYWDSEKESIQQLLYQSSYTTVEVRSVGKPATTDADGAMGWSFEGASSWASANLIAST